MQRYKAVRLRVCEFLRNAVEFGPFEADPAQTDAVCVAVAKTITCEDVIAVLDEVLASRGVTLQESLSGEWGWAGIRLKIQ